jgi:hypothetical protein
MKHQIPVDGPGVGRASSLPILFSSRADMGGLAEFMLMMMIRLNASEK